MTCSFVKCTVRKLSRKFTFVDFYTRLLDGLTLCMCEHIMCIRCVVYLYAMASVRKVFYGVWTLWSSCCRNDTVYGFCKIYHQRTDCRLQKSRPCVYVLFYDFSLYLGVLCVWTTFKIYFRILKVV